jgi:hypothetical protein
LPPSGWTLFPPAATTTDKGHGRLEVRHLWSSTALNTYLAFPHLGQVFCLHRAVTELATGTAHRETVYGVTSLPPAQASPARLLALVRAHWTIENRLHWVRDVTFDEDRSQIRRGAGPQVMATLRNLARYCGWRGRRSSPRRCGRRGGPATPPSSAYWGSTSRRRRRDFDAAAEGRRLPGSTRRI